MYRFDQNKFNLTITTTNLENAINALNVAKDNTTIALDAEKKAAEKVKIATQIWENAKIQVDEDIRIKEEARAEANRAFALLATISSQNQIKHIVPLTSLKTSRDKKKSMGKLKKPCFFFKKGICRYGLNCRNIH